MSRWALRLRLTSEDVQPPDLTGARRQPLVVAGLVALALLALGEAAPAAWLVPVSIEGHASFLQISVDGQVHTLSLVLGPNWRGISLEQPGPLEREYQIDGSDRTANDDRDPALIAALLDSPLYRFDAWLRDEASYSRWEWARVIDLATGEIVPNDGRLPHDFWIEAALRRPEAAAHLWLLGPTAGRREGLELNRDTRNARWVIQRDGGTDSLPRWFFPEQPGPFAAELLHLVGRSATAAYAMALSTLLVARAFSLLRSAGGVASTFARDEFPKEGDDQTRAVGLAAATSAGYGPPKGGENPSPEGQPPMERFIPSRVALAAAAMKIPSLLIFANERAGDLILAVWLVAAALVATRVFHQLPHILDAVSYTFQAGLFASGKLALDAPPLVAAFKGPFEVLSQGRLLSQYPPGASAAYALGQLVGLAWLGGPLACLTLIGATSWTARVLYGRACGLVVLGLGALSPFILFQAGSFLSHPIAGGLLAAALAAFVAGERDGRQRWYAASAVLLGLGFLTREADSLLFALPLAARLLSTRRWRPTLWLVVYGLPFVLVYLLYNTWQTGSPWLLPRSIFNPADRFGFGDGIGFHTRHTLAAGLANTDELLTVLQFDLFGWPPLLALGLLGVPFLFARARTWDALAAFGFLAFVVAYTAYFYHGIALGPRYYFGAMPWLLLLAGRGAQVLANLAGSRLAVGLLLGALSLNTVLFYLPAELQRRTDFSAMLGPRRVTLDFVQTSLFGPHLVGVPDHALVVTEDWWLYNTALAPLNCGRLPDCPVLFAMALSPEDQRQLVAQYPDRLLMRAVDDAGHIRLAALAP